MTITQRRIYRALGVTSEVAIAIDGQLSEAQRERVNQLGPAEISKMCEPIVAKLESAKA